MGDAANLMIRSNIRAVVVVENERAVGVLSQTDIVLTRQGRTQEEARTVKVREVMTPGILSCESNTSLTDAISMMTARRINRLLVTVNGRADGRHLNDRHHPQNDRRRCLTPDVRSRRRADAVEADPRSGVRTGVRTPLFFDPGFYRSSEQDWYCLP